MTFNPDIFLLNVQSLNSQTINFLEIDICKYTNLKFLCLTETHATLDSIYSKTFKNFSLASFYSRNINQKGGVAIYSRSCINTSKLDLDKFCIEKHIEMCGITWKDNNKTLIILTCYRSPSGDLNIFFSNIYSVLDMLFRPNVHIILNGDFNIDSTLNSRNINEFKNLCNILSSFNLQPLVRWPTRVTSCTSTIIDHIFTNLTNHSLVCVEDNEISDHRTVLFEFISDLKTKSDNVCFVKRNFSDNAVLSFYSALQAEDWSDIYRLKDINTAYENFHNTFIYYFNAHFPLRKYYKNNNVYKGWVNDDVKMSSIKLKDLHKLKNVYSELSPAYKHAKKEHALLVEKTKQQYYQHKIMNSNNPAKVAWNVISELSGRPTKKKYNIKN